MAPTETEPDSEPRDSDVTPSGNDPAGDEPKRRRSFWKELPVLLVIAFVAALLIKTFLLQAFFIPSASMVPTLRVGDRVLVEKISYRFGDPGRGDVVVFERKLPGLTGTDEADDESVFGDIVNAFRELFGFPTGTSQDFIKRVIGVEGETVEGRDGEVWVDGEPIEEPYLPEGLETAPFLPIKVGDEEIFVMGDNRADSEDSRSFGAIPQANLVGRAFLLVWPPADFGGL